MTKIQHHILTHNNLKKGLFLSLFACSFLYSQEQLDEIIVSENNKKALTNSIEKNNKTVINQENIDSFPKGNGNINEVLKYLPDIQAEGNIETSLNAGEIAPENLSISGGKFYNNNFLIDGTSNNSLLDPANNNANQINDVKGHPNEIFLDTDFIKSIEVYDSDVPARYGRFTGGVVDVKTKHADFNFSGKLKYRYTSDTFTKFFVSNKKDFANSNSSSMQPNFKKNFFGFSLNTPINETSAIYFNVALKDSTIPLKHFLQPKDTKRESINIFTKYSKYLEDDAILDLSFSFAPYEEKRFLTNVNNSDFIIKSGGYKAKASYEKDFDSFKYNSIFDFSFSENNREAPKDFYNWASNSLHGKNWGDILGEKTSREGGYGDIDKSQMILSLKNDFEFDFLNTGFEIQAGKAKFERQEDSYIYKVSSISNGNTQHPESSLLNLECNGSTACLEGDQFASSRTTYHAFNTNANILNTAAYVEKNFTFDRLNFRLGLRYDYNDYMKNHDIAYRTLSTYDLFGNQKSLINVGFNRYYSNSFLTYKLREAKVPYLIYTRGIQSSGNGKFTPQDWAVSSRQGSNRNRYNDLDTPYSDEKSISLNQKIFSADFTIKYIQRDFKNGFTRNYTNIQPDGYRYYELENTGESTHQSLRLILGKDFGNHYLGVNFTKNKTKRNSESYDDEVFDEGADTNIVYYNNKFVPKGSLTKENDTLADVLKLVYKYKYKNFTLHSFLNYKSKYQRLEETDKTKAYTEVNPQTGTTTFTDKPIYEVIEHGSSFKVDLSLAYEFKLRKNQSLNLRTDIKNVFNEKESLSSSTNTYYLGRQFWFELAYKF